MGGIAAIVRRDGKMVEPAALVALLARLHHLGPNGSHTHHCGVAAFGYQAFWITPEEVGAIQPMTALDGRFVLLFDGRLDNRPALLDALQLDTPETRTLSDAALALQAYLRWGEGCFARLLGVFVAVVYDCVERRLVCARDPLGDRTLFYAVAGDAVVLASEPAAVLAYPGVSRALDDHTLAHYYALRAPLGGRTFFAQVRELLPGHVLTVTDEDMRQQRYWTPDLEARLRYRSDGEYAEHFAALLAESVRCRLRALGRVGIMLSSGLDSTSVAAIAAQTLADQERQPLRSFTWSFDELASCDERAYLRPLLQRYSIDPTFIPADSLWPLKDLESLPNNPSLPDANAYRPLKQQLYAQAQAAGVRVLLSGADGDHLYLGGDEWLADLLADGRWAEAGREGLRQARRLGLSGLLRSNYVRRIGSRLLDQTPGVRGLRPVPAAELPSWLTDHARRLLMEAEAAAPAPRRAWRLERREALIGPRALRGESSEATYASRYGLEVRLPYRDRRLVEFALAVPAYQLYNVGRYKHVLRNAMAGVLPEPIRQQTRHGILTPLFTRGLVEREWERVQRLMNRPEPLWPRYVRSDWVSSLTPERLRARLAAARTEREGVVLYACIAAERWYNESFRSILD